jgi:hypothetical protein
MGNIRLPLQVKPFLGILYSDSALMEYCSEKLFREFGPPDLASEARPWAETNYYREEMGPGLFRRFIFFERLADPGRLPYFKLFTDALERASAMREGDSLRRRINLDPGYITEAKVVLATTKDFSHRVYVGEGIYAEATLRYGRKEGCFLPLEHTYPEFRDEACRRLFAEARALLQAALHSGSTAGTGGGTKE